MLTPRERAAAILDQSPMVFNEQWWEDQIVGAISSAISDQAAALQAALEDLARVKQKRDGLAAAIIEYRRWYDVCGYDLSAPEKLDAACAASDGLDAALGEPSKHLVTHDRQVAARVAENLAIDF